MATGKYLFQEIAKGNPYRASPSHNSQARKWLRAKASEITAVNVQKISGQGRSAGRISADSIGRMHMFFYDPKLKDKLPYYDRFPLIFPIELYADGFLGINLHYLPPVARAKLLSAIYDTSSNSRLNSETRLNLSYRILNGAARYRLFKPCVKRYLHTHVRSRFVLVDPAEWDIAIMLPTARFEKAQEQDVWEDSMSRPSRGRK